MIRLIVLKKACSIFLILIIGLKVVNGQFASNNILVLRKVLEIDSLFNSLDLNDTLRIDTNNAIIPFILFDENRKSVDIQYHWNFKDTAISQFGRVGYYSRLTPLIIALDVCLKDMSVENVDSFIANTRFMDSSGFEVSIVGDLLVYGDIINSNFISLHQPPIVTIDEQNYFVHCYRVWRSYLIEPLASNKLFDNLLPVCYSNR